MTEVERLEKELLDAKLKLEQAREKEKHSARNLAIKDLLNIIIQKNNFIIFGKYI